MLMKKKTITYIPPQICAEPFDCPFGLCQASGGEFNAPETVDDLIFTD